ncbi:MAG TPA: TetR/AcrR family transcriptional regulator [Gemmataceae bacterium]|jgi:AcrR family transcriptional regulator|nr:TetR/AcrR family transcriptional regulator [Gemmataceae bacterium]
MPTGRAPAAAPRRYAGRSAEERDAERRSRLRETALHLFGTEGYAAVPVERLCTEAKVSTRHFYQLFSNKEDALLDVYADLTAESIGNVGTVLDETAGQPVEERLVAGFRAYIGPILADSRKARLAFVEIVGISPRVEERRLQFRNSIIAVFEFEMAAAVERGELEPRDFRFLALSFLGAVNVVVHDWSLNPNHAAAESLQEQLCGLAVELFTGARSPSI